MQLLLKGSGEVYVDVNGMKIILVDDSAPVRKHMRPLLSAIAQVDIIGEAETPGAALRLIHKLQPEVVILDVALREGSGFDVLTEVKKQKNPPIVIVLTNYSTTPFRKKAREEGADFFFDKSTEFEKLIEVLQRKKITRRGFSPCQG